MRAFILPPGRSRATMSLLRSATALLVALGLALLVVPVAAAEVDLPAPCRSGFEEYMTYYGCWPASAGLASGDQESRAAACVANGLAPECVTLMSRPGCEEVRIYWHGSTSYGACASVQQPFCDTTASDYVVYFGCGAPSTGLGAQQDRTWVAACYANHFAPECASLALGRDCTSVAFYWHGTTAVPVCGVN